jgi:TonB family protein
MKTLLRRSAVGTLLLAAFLFLIFLVPISSRGQAASTRRILIHSAPSYPSLARSMALQGVVRVEALVAPDGSVKDVAIKGGHPVLAQAAVNTVRRWRWEPASHESHEIVELKFSPEE